MNTLEHMQLYEFLYDKSVVLIGGKDNYDENIINSADVVVRVNQHVLRQGGRCEGLYVATCDPCRLSELETPPVFMAWRISGVYAQEYREYALRNRLLRIPYQNERYGKVSPHGPEYEWTNIFGHELNAKPFTGVLAIKHLCSFPIRTLYVTGMDMHTGLESRKPDENGEQTRRYSDVGIVGRHILKRGPHEIYPQLYWLDAYAEYDKRLVLCDDLREALNG